MASSRLSMPPSYTGNVEHSALTLTEPQPVGAMIIPESHGRPVRRRRSLPYVNSAPTIAPAWIYNTERVPGQQNGAVELSVDAGPLSHMDAVQSDHPPEYVSTGRPTEPTTYKFNRLSHDSMLLRPSSRSLDSHPQYHISVSMNCFVPSSYITTVHRGASDFGPYIGDFEMGGGTQAPNTVCVSGNEERISRALQKRPAWSNPDRWVWTLIPKRKMTWEYKTFRGLWTYTEATCYLFPDNVDVSKENRVDAQLLATFRPKSRFRKQGRALEVDKLVVQPEGLEHFEHVLMSLLVIERIRLTVEP